MDRVWTQEFENDSKSIEGYENFFDESLPEQPFDYHKFFMIFLKHARKNAGKKGQSKLIGKRAKSNAKAQEFRKNGNIIFKDSQTPEALVQALKLYTQCISHAVAGSEEMSYGYGNR